MKPCLVVGLNQTIDRTLGLGRLEPGSVMRTDRVRVTGGGKAVNVARACMTLDHPAQLLGPFPGSLGDYARRLLEAEGLTLRPVACVDGEIRGTTIILEDDGRSSVVNEVGPPLVDGGFDQVLEAVEGFIAAAADGADGPGWMVVSGSMPPNTPAAAHQHLIRLGHDHRWRVAVDVTGNRLVAALEAGADLVSPNLSEANAALGGDGSEVVDRSDLVARDEAIAAAKGLQALAADRNLATAMVSAGRFGVAIANADDVAFVPAAEVAVANPIGAGDSLLAATVVALSRGYGPIDAARRGVAYAAASVADPVGGYADREVYASLLAAIEPAESGSQP